MTFRDELLKGLIHKAKSTEIGNQYDFKSIKTIKILLKEVPVTDYEDNQSLYERARKGESNIFWPSPIKWFAKSSGTTNARSKFLPVSHES